MYVYIVTMKWIFMRSEICNDIISPMERMSYGIF